MLRIATLAEAHGVRLVPHCAYFGPGWLASLHLHIALSPQAPFERLFIDLEASPYHDRVLAPDGFVTVPDGPGLGLDPDRDVLARYRVSQTWGRQDRLSAGRRAPLPRDLIEMAERKQPLDRCP